MQSKTIMLVILACITIASCGKTTQDKAWQKKLQNDSMGYEAIADVDKSGVRQVRLKLLKAKYEKTKYDYDIARDKLRTIEEFHLARTPEKKEEQVQKQNKYIHQLDDSLQKLSGDISRLEKRTHK